MQVVVQKITYPKSVLKEDSKNVSIPFAGSTKIYVRKHAGNGCPMAGRNSPGQEITEESPFIWEDKVHYYEIPYVPKAQGRPRVTVNGTYNPNAKQLEAMHWQLKAQRKCDTFEGPLAVTVIFTYPNPQRRKLYAPSTRPDCDNLVKSVIDSGNNCLWFDDAQIVELHVIKRYLDQ